MSLWAHVAGGGKGRKRQRQYMYSTTCTCTCTARVQAYSSIVVFRSFGAHMLRVLFALFAPTALAYTHVLVTGRTRAVTPRSVVMQEAPAQTAREGYGGRYQATRMTKTALTAGIVGSSALALSNGLPTVAGCLFRCNGV